MATTARQQYFADEDSLQKIRREFSIADEIQQKIDSIEPGAQVNKIETVKVNGTALVPDANKAVNVEVPEVIDNLYTVDSDNALSAKQGKLLYDYIQNIASRGRFLSNWNSATGLPMTNPSENPYPYKSGDYFIVSNVAGLGGTNYRPDGSSYIIGQASTVVETDSVDVSDFYFYDGTNWLLLKNSGRSGAVDSSLSTTSTNPVENRVITNALNGKQETLIAGSNIQIAADGKTISATDTTYSAGANISINANNEISAVDTTYTAGTGISIDANNVISNTQTSAQWGNITGTLSNQTDLQNALDSKVNLGMNKVFDSTVVEIGKWEHEPGGDSSGHHIELDPNGEVSTYNLTQAGHNEATLGSGTLELLNNTVLDGNKTATFDHEKIVADDGTNTNTYNFFGNDRIAKLSDLDSGVNTKTFFLNREATQAEKIATLQEVYDWIKDGTRNAIIEAIDEEAGNLYPDRTFILSDWWDSEASGNPITFLFQNGFVHDNFTQETLSFIVLNDVVTSYTHNQQRKIARAGNGINIANNEISNTLPGPTIAATAPTGTEGALWYDTTNDVLMAHNGTAWKEAGTQMKVLSYGHSTWQDFLDAYNENAIVYCRASSQSNPGSGNQTRMAFMAFVDINATTGVIQGVEFQYYRSRNAHSTAATVLDEVYIYKLTSNGTWTVTQRDTAAKPIAGTGIGLTYNSSGMTISADTTTLATKTDLSSKQDTLIAGSNIQIASDGKTISATDTTYTAGNNIQISSGNVISATDTTYNAGEGITIGTMHSDMQGPAPDGYHIPLHTEWQSLINVWGDLGFTEDDIQTFTTYFHIPLEIARSFTGADDFLEAMGVCCYWSADGDSDRREYYILYLEDNYPSDNHIEVQTTYGISESLGYPIRAFKDVPVIPDNNWTILHQGTGNAGIFYNSALGIISISGDGINWITVADKNIGATVVYNNGDTISSDNVGYVYQRGNNYGFAPKGTITTSSGSVDASTYGPGNYYSSSTFITRTQQNHNVPWDSSQNRNLWGGVSKGTWIDSSGTTIANTGVLSVNGQAGAVTINEFNPGGTATTGYVVTKTANGYQWQAPTGGLQVAPNSPITGIKYVWYGTEADYNNLNQYYTDTPGDTEFRCF